MDRSKIKNITCGGLTLPSPYSGTMPPGLAVIVEGTVDEVIANLGGDASIRGIMTVEEALDSNALDVHSASNNAKAIRFAAPAAAGVASHAQVDAGDANEFPGAFADPVVPRVLQAVFSAAWDGGDITVAGTDAFDLPQTDVIAAAVGVTVQGVAVFKTVTGISKGAVGTGGQTVDVETGIALGIVERVRDASGMLAADGTSEVVVIDPVENKFTPTTVPDGAVVYDLICNV